MNELLFLINQTWTDDEYGDPVLVESVRKVFCREQSVGQKEFYEAHAKGFKVEKKFILADYLDYKDEMLLEHNGQRYRVLRTYRAGHELEIVCYREVNPV